MINPNQIKGSIGQTLEDDIKYLKENSATLRVISNTISHDNVTDYQKVLVMSELIDTKKHSILESNIEITNTSTTNIIDFKIIDNGKVLYGGKIDADKTMMFSTSRPNLSVEVNGNCKVNYTIKYF